MERCWAGRTRCVVFSGGIERGRKESERLICVPDTDLIEHAEEGVSFLERFGLLHLTAWTRGARQAVRAEVVSVCGKIRAPFLAPHAATGPVLPDFSGIVEQLRQWSNNPHFLSRIDLLSRLLTAESFDPGSATPDRIRAVFHAIDEIIQIV